MAEDIKRNNKTEDKEIAVGPFLVNCENFLNLLCSVPEDDLPYFLGEMSEVLSKFEHNAAVLRAKDSAEDDVLALLLHTVISFSKGEFAVINQLFLLIEKLIQSLPAEVYHYEIIYQAMSTAASKCRSRDEVQEYYELFYVCAELLRIFAKRVDGPAHFCFTPSNGKLVVNLPGYTPWPFRNGYTFMAWIKPGKVSEMLQSSATLLRIKGDTVAFELLVSGKVVYYVSGKTKSEIGTLEEDTWQQFAVAHGVAKGFANFYSLMGTKERFGESLFPVIPIDEQLQEITLFEGFVGAVTTCTLMATAVPPSKIKEIFMQFPHGVSDQKSLNLLLPSPLKLRSERIQSQASSSGSLIPDCYFLLTPLYRSENRLMHNLHYSDLDLTGELQGNYGVFGGTIGYVDPLRNVLPLLHLSCIVCDLIRHFKGTIRSIKEAKTFLKILEHQLKFVDPTAISTEFLHALKKIMGLNTDLHIKVLMVLINTANIWINTDLSVYEEYWRTIIEGYEQYHEKIGLVINVSMIINIMETLGIKKTCCAASSNNVKNVNYYLNIRYEPVAGLLKKLILDNPKVLAKNLALILHVIAKKPCHCLLKSLINLIITLCDTRDVVLALNNMKGFPLICRCATEYTVDIKIACLELFRKHLVEYNNKEINKGVELLFATALTKSSHRSRPLSKAKNTSKETNAKSAIKERGNHKRSKSDSFKRKELEKVELPSEIKPIYCYLVNWLTGQRIGSEHTMSIKNEEALRWMIKLGKKAKYEDLSIQILLDINTILQGNPDNMEIIVRDKRVVNWLINVEKELYIKISLDNYVRFTQLHTQLLIKAFNSGIYGIDFLKPCLSKGDDEGLHIQKILWNQVINHMHWRNFHMILQPVYELITLTTNTHQETLYRAKHLLFGLPYASSYTILSSFFELVQEFCHDLLKACPFGLFLNELKDVPTIHLKMMNRFPYPQKHLHRVAPLTCITTLFSIAVRCSRSIAELKNILASGEILVEYCSILLEFAKATKDSASLEMIGDSIIALFALLFKEHSTKIVSRETEVANIIAIALAKMLKKVLKLALAKHTACLELYKTYFGCQNGNLILPLDQIVLTTPAEELAKKVAESYPTLQKYKVYLSKAAGFELENMRKLCNKPHPIINNKAETALTKCKEVTAYDMKEHDKKVLDFLLSLELRRRKCEHKWRKIHRSLKQWQGFWRDKQLFDTLEGNTMLPYKVSSHCFRNTMRCVIKVRSYPSKYLANTRFERYGYPAERNDEFYYLLNTVTPINLEFYEHEIQAIDLDKIQVLIGNNISPLLELISPKENLQDLLLPTALDCELFCFLLAKRGKLLLSIVNNHGFIKFVHESFHGETNPKEDKRLMFGYAHPKSKKLVKKWCISDLTSITKKYIVDSKSGAELAFGDGRTVLLNFFDEDKRDLFCTKLARLREKLYREKSDIVYDGAKALEKLKATHEWLIHSISTFDYILLLNSLSSRSFANSSQYPVMPWILADYDAAVLDLKSEKVYRDLSKPVGMMGSQSRAETFMNRFIQADLTGLGHFNYGSHYSNPGIVLQYMMRVYPFFEGYVQFFTGFDDPNRMFNSLTETFRCACNDPSDVRELIPEFFALPEMLVNSSGHRFGIREDDKQPVNHVLLPAWSKENPYHFITLQRAALESDKVGARIQKWIDLIFGYQQRGKEAEKVSNVFPLLTTEPAGVLMEYYGEMRDEFRFQAFHWGQTPQQLFIKPHQQRPIKGARGKLLCDEGVAIKVCCAKSAGEKQMRILRESVIVTKDLKLLNEQRKKETEDKGKVVAIRIVTDLTSGVKFVMVTTNGMIIEGTAERMEMMNGTISSAIKLMPPKLFVINYVTQEKYRTTDPTIGENPPIVIIKRRGVEQIAQGGYLDGSIRITSTLNPSSSFVLYTHFAAVSALSVDSNERFAVSGSSKGECLIYNIGDSLVWTVKGFLLDHKGKINWIYISNEMQIFATASADGSANLYTKGVSPKLIRTLRHPKGLPIDYVFLAASPLPCAVIFSCIENAFYSYSINGCLQQVVKEPFGEIISPVIARDSSFNNCLAYINTAENALVVRKLPSLERRKAKPLDKEATVLVVSDNQLFGLLGHEDGSCSLACACLGDKAKITTHNVVKL